MPRDERKQKKWNDKGSKFFFVVVVHIKYRLSSSVTAKRKTIILILHSPRRFYVHAIQCVVLFFFFSAPQKEPTQKYLLTQIKAGKYERSTANNYSWNLGKKVAWISYFVIYKIFLYLCREKKKTFMKAHAFAFGECQFNFLAKPQIRALQTDSRYTLPETNYTKIQPSK